jgi:MFS family permease
MILITAGVTGIVTSVTMIGPLLVDISLDLGISLGQAGLLAAAAGVPQALFSPFSGLLSDRLGRKPMIVTAFASVAVLSFGAALAPSFAALAVARFLAGLLGSLAPTSLMASVGDLFPAERGPWAGSTWASASRPSAVCRSWARSAARSAGAGPSPPSAS